MRGTGLRCVGLGAAAAMLGSCAIRPLPEHWAGLDTYEITRAIRCEAREAISHLMRHGLDGGTSHANQVAPSAHSRPIILAQDFASKYGGVGLAYDLELDVSESNDSAATIGAKGKWGIGTFGLSGKSDYKRIRKNKRTFVVSDKVSEIEEELQAFCSGYGSHANRIYPITGRIGLAEALKTFVELNEVGRKSDSPKVGALKDVITFTTTVSSEAGPNFSADIGVGELRIIDASYKATLSRTDTHQLTLAMSFPSPAAKPSTPGKKPAAVSRLSSGEQNAIQEIQNLKTEEFFQKVERLERTFGE